MTLTAIVLLVVAAFVHAGWNLLTKHAHPTAAFFLVANTFGCLCLAPVLLLYGNVAAAFPARVWVLLAGTGFCLAVYMATLAGAYRTGHLSIAYPIARSAPVVVVAGITFALGKGHQITPQCLFGILLVAGGCFALPMRRFRDFRARNYLNLSCLLALAAAFGTAGYMLIDDEALRRLREAPGLSAGPAQATIVYAFFEGLSSSAWLALYVLLRKNRRSRVHEVIRASGRNAALTGIGMYVAYTLVLLSMAFVANVSYVAAFRQLSILFGAVFGVVILKEPRHVPKFVGVAFMFLGLVLVGTG